ncbi:centrosomal protein 43 isoform X2 [Ascaphus truei]|uniref:centrosomal protein 43 isoform X2 n=1 Tax=Ascaphus truei TaxID=8439 RepID=UPI003F5A623A
MSAAEEDTELRDLLIQTLENSGVLNKIKAELRASVFLALEEQEKVENKIPLVNESLKKFLNARDGRLIASLFSEFLQFFNLDFTLAVFQPEACLFQENGPDDRSPLARDLGIIESEGAKSCPLILELVKRWRQKDKIISGGEQSDKPVSIPKELSPKQIAEAQKKFEIYDKDRNGEISKDELRVLFVDLFPHFHRNMLERYVNDEFKAADKDLNNGIDFHEFIGMYKRFFIHCRSVVTHDVSDIIHSPRRIPEGKTSAHGTYSKVTESSSESSLLSRESKKKSESHTPINTIKPDSILNNLILDSVERNDLELDEDDLEGDSFFDDPIPKHEKTYCCQSSSDANNSGEFISEIGGSTSQKLASDKNSYTEDVDDCFLEKHRQNSPERRNEPSKLGGGLASLSAAPPLNTGLRSHQSGAPRLKDPDKETQLASLKDLKAATGKIASLELGAGDEDDDYVDDFNSTSHRSDKSEVSIGEEIEEEISVDDFNGSDKLEDLTLDHTISNYSDMADYLEDVS